MGDILTTQNFGESEITKLSALVEELTLDSPVGVLLQHIVSAHNRGSDVALLEFDRELTPNQAAELLQMSRPHLLGFMDRGQLAFHRVGSHRRIRLSDLLDFYDRREKSRAAVAEAVGNATAIENQVRDEGAVLTEEDLVALDAL